jgi:hypothetical protein
MPKAVKDKREVIREAIRRYKDPVRAWAVWALKEGATQALEDLWEEVQPTPEDAREVYGLVDKGVLTVGEATLLLRVRKDPGFVQGRERAVRALLAKLRERPEA